MSRPASAGRGPIAQSDGLLAPWMPPGSELPDIAKSLGLRGPELADIRC